MTSLHTCADRRPNRTRGFTIIELILVIALGILLVGLTLPQGVAFYQSIVADDAADELAAALRSASRSAVLGKNDTAHGVMMGSGEVTVFQGSSYAARVVSGDVVIPIPSGVVVSGIPNEIVFARSSGTPSATGTLSVSLYGKTHDIRIDENGLIILDP